MAIESSDALSKGFIDLRASEQVGLIEQRYASKTTAQLIVCGEERLPAGFPVETGSKVMTVPRNE